MLLLDAATPLYYSDYRNNVISFIYIPRKSNETFSKKGNIQINLTNQILKKKIRDVERMLKAMIKSLENKHLNP